MDIEHTESLIAYLRSEGQIGRDEKPECRPLRGGVSNRTVLVERANGDAWVLKQSLGKLRVSVDWFSDPERIHREALGMHWLGVLLPQGAVPELIFEDRDHDLIAMEAIAPPNPTWKQLLLDGELRDEHVEAFAELLAELHRSSYERRRTLRRLFDDRSHFESLRVEPFYQYTGKNVAAAETFMRDLVDDARRRRLTLVHGDYSPKNVLVHAGRLVLLDHEIIHFGDPAFDIGFSTTHLLSKGHVLVDMRAEFASAVRLYWRTYRDGVGDAPWTDGLEARAVRHTLGCLAARAAGRSPLEYLDDPARDRQLRATCVLMADPPARMQEVSERFLEMVGDVDHS